MKTALLSLIFAAFGKLICFLKGPTISRFFVKKKLHEKNR